MSFVNYENVGYVARDCGGKTLRYDEACLQVIATENVSFWSQYTECEGCVLLETASFNSTGRLVLKTTSPLQYSILNNQGEICNGTYQFGEFGQYLLNLTEVTRDECPPRMLAEPDAPLLPLLTAAVVLLSMATLWYVVKGIGKRLAAGRLYARYFAREDNELGSETRVLTTESTLPRPPPRSRLRSLDIFRGITIALMIFCNAGGGGYAIFSHSVWNGLTVADVVFPWLAFCMGEALVLSLNARLRTSMSRLTALGQVARRSLFMALIGISLGSVDAGWQTVRLPGVLQRLAAMYLLAGALECACMKTTQTIIPGRSLFRDISAGWIQWLATAAIVAIQVTLSLTIAAPGCPRGYLGPGGLHLSAHNQSLQNCTGGIAGYIDRMVFGASHLYQRGTFKQLYHTTVPHDPEGLLGTLSGLLVVQAGAHATRIMLAYNHARARILRWALWAALGGAGGAALALAGGGGGGGGVLPLNKNLWSASYCLATAGLAFFCKAALYYVVDLKNKWGGRPFYYAGQNALFLYVGSELLQRHFPFRWALAAPSHAALLASHAGAALLWLAVAVALHRRRVFVTL